MRYEVHTQDGAVPVDMVDQTVGKGPGYKLTVPGYASVALFERDGRYWNVTISTPGRYRQHTGRLDSRVTDNVVQAYGGRMLVRYIEENAIPLRTGALSPYTPADRDASYRTGRGSGSGRGGGLLDAILEAFD